MPIVKHDVKHAGSDWLFGIGLVAAVLLLVWLAQLVATGLIYLGEMLM
ncbi:hypothetical protein [Sphingomonas sp. 1P08PE]